MKSTKVLRVVCGGDEKPAFLCDVALPDTANMYVMRQALRKQWTEFQEGEPDSDSLFGDFLKKRGWTVVENIQEIFLVVVT